MQSSDQYLVFCDDAGDVQVEYYNTDSMLKDFFNEPLQENKYLEFRKLILGM